MYTWDWGGDLTSLTRVNLQCSASCKEETAICSRWFVLLFLNTTQNYPVLSDFTRLRKTTPAYVQSRAFTLQRQVIDKTSSKNIHLQGCLENPAPRWGGKMSFSHPTLTWYTAFTDQNSPWCSITTCFLTQHPTQTAKQYNDNYILQNTDIPVRGLVGLQELPFAIFTLSWWDLHTPLPYLCWWQNPYQLQRKQYSINTQQFSTELIV